MRRHRDVAPVAGTRLHYEIQGTGPSVVLIHGFALDSRMWDGQMDTLAMRYQVIRYDMRGFGRSAVPEGERYTAAGDLKALLEHLGVDRAAIVGLSLGGGVAADFALTYPEATQSLVLADATLGGWEWSSGWNERIGPVWSAGKELGIEAAKERWLALPLFQPAQEQPEVDRSLKRMVAEYSGWHWLHEDPQQYLDPPAIQRLGEIAALTLIVLGERDEPDFHGIAAALRRGIPDAEMVAIPGVGHMSNMEATDQFNELVLRFLDELRR